MNDLILALVEANRIEEEARERRIDAEQALIAQLGELKQEGAQTIKADGYKLTVTTGINRRIDHAALDAIRKDIPPALFDMAIRWKPEPITAGLRYLQNNEPEAYAVLAQAITASPAKPSVRVERIEP